jgi:hypothetical protein
MLVCAENGIDPSEMRQYPGIVDQFFQRLDQSTSKKALALLHLLYKDREQLGFVLLDRDGLIQFEFLMDDKEGDQTAYIPPRIWSYQVNRLREFLDDFHEQRDKIVACYDFCIDAYVRNFGSLTEACRSGADKKRNPFGKGRIAGCEYHGRFADTAERFGIDGLLAKWCIGPDQSLSSRGISVMSKYFSMVGHVGTTYLLNFSLMRVSECWALRTQCLRIEKDERFGPFFVLHGPTTKTIRDDDACWPASPSVQVAVEAMACVARLRMRCAEANPDVTVTAEELANPNLVVRCYEPWAYGEGRTLPPTVRKGYLSYKKVLERYPNLFDDDQLRITQADLDIMRAIAPDLDAEEFAVGLVFPLAWHQLRRTGAVNMQSSDLVSDATLQYQLKHSRRAMSLYYGKGYSRVGLNQEARNQYVGAMYEVLGKQFAGLFEDRFVSPYGEARKAALLNLVAEKDAKTYAALAKEGKIAWRETLLGGCMKRGPCSYGGVDNIARCGGGDRPGFCVEILLDRDKIPELQRLRDILGSQIAEAAQGSPYRLSLEAQQRAVENALHVLDNRS